MFIYTWYLVLKLSNLPKPWFGDARIAVPKQAVFRNMRPAKGIAIFFFSICHLY
jgi:hypothetical protein